MLYELITQLCWDSKSNRLIPKRSMSWLAKNHQDTYQEITEKFPGIELKSVYYFLKSGYSDYTSVPNCHCGNKVIVYGTTVLEVCSNRCSIKSKKTQLKTKATCMKKYGAERKWGKPVKGDEHHLRKHLINLSDVTNHELMTKLQHSNWKDVAQHFGLSTKTHSSAFKFMASNGYPILSKSGKSNMESEVAEYVSSLGVAIQTNTKKIISPYELDVFIESHNLAIEFNGLYWHSSGSTETDALRKQAHLMKTEMCEAKGIQLLHIFENEWLDPVKKEIWKSVIKHKLGLSKVVYARKCVKKPVPKADAIAFCEANHLQGSCGFSNSMGLYYNDELVQVATFGKPRYNKSVDLELIRLCSKQGLCIVGGASKLTKGVSFVSYGNRRWCSALSNVYDKIGTSTGTSEPCYWYFEKNSLQLFHRSSFMKHKLKDKLENFDQSKTEVENCYANGLRRIWDCGNLIYEVRGDK